MYEPFVAGINTYEAGMFAICLELCVTRYMEGLIQKARQCVSNGVTFLLHQSIHISPTETYMRMKVQVLMYGLEITTYVDIETMSLK